MSRVYPDVVWLRSTFTFTSLAASYLQVFWLLHGTYQLVERKSVKPIHINISYGAIVLVAIVSSLVFAFDYEYSAYRVFIRIGLKSLIIGASFILAGVLVMQTKRRDRSVGRRLVYISFIIYGFEQLQYFISALEYLFGEVNTLGTSFTLGVFDFLLLALIGVGMVIWLLEDERAKLLKTNRELDSFLYSTSHDLRAPVASMLGLINLAKHDVKEEEAQKYIGMMEERVEKLDHIFSDILNYSRNIKTEIKYEVVRLGAILDDIVADLKFNEGAETIRLDYKEEVEHVLKSDPHQLKIILTNLISNAVKYHDRYKQDQYIAVRFHTVHNNVIITVEDNGKGIPKKNQAKVFEMFYRASSEAEGSGLGLFIVKQALEKIQGTISLKSEEGYGSRFMINLADAVVQVH